MIADKINEPRTLSCCRIDDVARELGAVEEGKHVFEWRADDAAIIKPTRTHAWLEALRFVEHDITNFRPVTGEHIGQQGLPVGAGDTPLVLLKPNKRAFELKKFSSS